MTRSTSFDEVYERKLLPKLQELERKRKQAVWVLLSIFFTGCLIALAVLFLSPKGGFVSFMVSTGISVVVYVSMNKGHKNRFKNTIIRELAKLVNNSVRYTESGYYDLDNKEASNLLQRTGDRMVSEDGFTGNLDGVDFKVSETILTEGSGKHKRTVFYGYFMEVLLNTSLENSYWIAHQSQLEPKFVDKVDKWLSGTKYFLESKNKLDQQLPRSLWHYRFFSDGIRSDLNIDLINNMPLVFKEIEKQSGEKVGLKAYDNKLFLVFETDEDKFEAGFFETLLNKKVIERHHKEIQRLMEIVRLLGTLKKKIEPAESQVNSERKPIQRPTSFEDGESARPD